MEITTRAIGEDDLDAVAHLFDLYRQFYAQPSNMDLARAFLSNRIAFGESVILAAESDKLGIVGFCQLYPSFCSVEAKPIYVLYDLFVLPAARRWGTGRLLLEAAEAKAMAEGKARMDLTTAKSNLSAQALYESHGWLRDEVFFAYSKSVSAAGLGRSRDAVPIPRRALYSTAPDGDTLAP